MDQMRNVALMMVGLLALGAAGVSPVGAQRFPGLGGFEARVGLVLPDEVNAGVGAAADVDLGYIVIPQLRPVIGLDYFRAGVSDRAFGSRAASGSLSAIGGRAGVRFDLSGMETAQPYVITALTGHSVTAEGDTPEEQNDLDREFGGFVVGASVGAGAAFALDEAKRFRGVAELRRVWNANASHYALDVGLRIVPRGSAAYDPVDREDRDVGALPDSPDSPDPAADADDARAERVAAETERERAERERERAEEEAARGAQQERQERLTDEQRRRGELETEEARARAEREAAARAAAEREAERARQEAEAARSEAEAARREAREAEERLYRSLEDLNRLMTSVMAVRETERGLSIILGEGLFGVGQSALSPRARGEVGRIAAVLTQYPQHRIAVEGHTDSMGSPAANRALSEERANAVYAALIATGIDPGRVTTIGHGQRLPIADNATAAGRAQNRRVEIVVLGARRPGR